MKLSEHITRILGEARCLVEGPSHEFNNKLNNAISVWAKEAANLEAECDVLRNTISLLKNENERLTKLLEEQE